MQLVKQSILAVLIMSCFMFFFYQAFARADDHWTIGIIDSAWVFNNNLKQKRLC
jgi:hypothetical protein